MQLTLEQYESIQNYLDGKMPPEEQRKFLDELNLNFLLNENFRFEKELRQNLRSLVDKKTEFENENSSLEEDTHFENEDLIRSLIERSAREWKNEYELSPINIAEKSNFSAAIDSRRKPRIITMNPWIITAAAACIIIAIVSLKWFIPGPGISPSIAVANDTSGNKKDTFSGVAVATGDSLKNAKSAVPKISYAALFKKYHSKDLSAFPMPDILATVPANYRNGDYAFQQIDLDNQPHFRGSPNDINSPQNIRQLGHYYKGISFIETNNNRQAVENLQWVIDSSLNPQLKIKAQWYLSLTYLKEGNTKMLTRELSSLSTNSRAIPYNKKAAEILDELKQPQK